MTVTLTLNEQIRFYLAMIKIRMHLQKTALTLDIIKVEISKIKKVGYDLVRVCMSNKLYVT